jgi:hypothetical protein
MDIAIVAIYSQEIVDQIDTRIELKDSEIWHSGSDVKRKDAYLAML